MLEAVLPGSAVQVQESMSQAWERGCLEGTGTRRVGLNNGKTI